MPEQAPNPSDIGEIDYNLSKKELREAVRDAEAVHALVDPAYFPERGENQWMARVKVDKAWATKLIAKTDAGRPLGLARYKDNAKKIIIVPVDPMS